MSAAAEPAARSVSHQITRERFSREKTAARYPSEYGKGWRDRREQACIEQCLEAIPEGGRVLDLPCGTGRLTRILVSRGYRVTGADISEAMLEQTRANYAAYQSKQGGKAPAVQFEVRDVMSTGYNTDQFDGIACIRLFHHFSEAETRRRALRELRRICRGPIVV